MAASTKSAAEVASGLPRVPASDVKRRGWRGVMRTLRVEGAVVVTNHDQPEAVILAADTYAQLVEQASKADERLDFDLAALRQRFDERLAALRKPDAGRRLRAVMGEPASLRGKVRAGDTY